MLILVFDYIFPDLFPLFLHRLFFRNTMKKETERERLLIVHQVNRDIIRGRFPINRELALELSVLMAQVSFHRGIKQSSFVILHCH